MLKQQLMNDLKQAMKEKDTIKKNTIQLIRAEILQEEKDKQIELDDTQILEITSKQHKQKLEALKEFEKANRQDLIDQTNKEIDVLKTYLPKPITIEEIRAEAEHQYNLCTFTKKEMGLFIQHLKTILGPGANGKDIAIVVKEILNRE